jgi:hypothetical protein
MRTWLLLLLLCLIAFGPLKAQDLIQGMVVDSATFTALPYVNVTVKNKHKGTITDTNGNFKLVTEPGDTLAFSFVGYKTVEVGTAGWEASVVLMAENPTVLKTVTIEGMRINPYEGLFDEEDAEFKSKLKTTRFYQSRAKKQKFKIHNLQADNQRVKTYVEVVIQNEETKKGLMAKYHLTEKQYYDVLSRFNAQHYTIMYYLTAGELLTLLNSFFNQHAGTK